MNFIYIISYTLPFFDEYCRICGLPLNNIEDIYNQINNNFNIEWMKEILFLYNNKEYIIHSYDGFGRFIIEGNIDDIPSQFIEKNQNNNKLFYCNSIYNKCLNNCLVHKKCINRTDLGNINKLIFNDELPYNLFNQLNFYKYRHFDWKSFLKNYSFILNNPIKDNYWKYPDDLKYTICKYNYDIDIYYKNILFKNLNIYKDINLNNYIKIDNYYNNILHLIIQLNDILHIDIIKIIINYYKIIHTNYINLFDSNINIIDYYIYNKKRYNVNYGSRNGTYILINNKKKYIKYNSINKFLN